METRIQGNHTSPSIPIWVSASITVWFLVSPLHQRSGNEPWKKCWKEPVAEALEPFYSRRDEILILGGSLIWGIRIAVPRKLRLKVLEELHQGHLGVVKMKALARSYMDKEMKILQDLPRVSSELLQEEPRKTPYILGNGLSRPGSVSVYWFCWPLPWPYDCRGCSFKMIGTRENGHYHLNKDHPEASKPPC